MSSDQRYGPWILFYQARLAEGLGNLSEAQQGYSQLLSWISNPQLSPKIRRGLEKIKLLEEQSDHLQNREKREPVMISGNDYSLFYKNNYRGSRFGMNLNSLQKLLLTLKNS